MTTALLCWDCKERVDARRATACGCGKLLQTCPDDPKRNWVVKEQLGEGGFSHVYRVEGPDGKSAAMKVFNKDVDSKITRRAKKERRALATLTHPGIVRIIDEGEIARSGRPYIVQEVIEGESLSALAASVRTDLLRRNLETTPKELLRFRVDFAISVILSVADALGAAHQAGIAHRDIKPDNIMMAKCSSGSPTDAWQATWTPKGWFRPVIIDFNISRSIDVTKAETTSEEGTWQYGAPEQFAGDQSVVGNNPSQDVYAMAVTFFELLTDKTPYQQHRQPLSYYEQVRFAMDLLQEKKLPLDIGQENPSISPLIQRIIARAIRGLPSARYPSAPYFGLALARAAIGDEGHDDFSGISSIHECRAKLLDAMNRVRGRLAPNHRPVFESSLWVLTHRSMNGSDLDRHSIIGNAVCVNPIGVFLSSKVTCEAFSDLVAIRPGGSPVPVAYDDTIVEPGRHGLAILRISTEGVEPYKQAEPFPAAALPETLAKTDIIKKAYVLGFRQVVATALAGRGLRPLWTEVTLSHPVKVEGSVVGFDFACPENLLDDQTIGCPIIDVAGTLLGIVNRITSNGGRAVAAQNLARWARPRLSRKVEPRRVFDDRTVLSDEDAIAFSYFVRSLLPTRTDKQREEDRNAAFGNRGFARYLHVARALHSATTEDTLQELLSAVNSPGTISDPFLLDYVRLCAPKLKEGKSQLAVIAAGAPIAARITLGRLLLANGDALLATYLLQSTTNHTANALLAAAHLMLGNMRATREHLELAGDSLMAEGLRAIIDARSRYYTLVTLLSEKEEDLRSELRILPGMWAFFLHARALALAGCNHLDDARKYADWAASKRLLDDAISELRARPSRMAFGVDDMISAWCMALTDGRTGPFLSVEEARLILNMTGWSPEGADFEVMKTDAYLKLFMDSLHDLAIPAIPGASITEKLRQRAEIGYRHRLRYAYALYASGQHQASLAQVGQMDRMTFSKKEKALWSYCVGNSLFHLVAEELSGAIPGRWLTRLADAECDVDVDWVQTAQPAPNEKLSDALRWYERTEEKLRDAERVIQSLEARLTEMQRAHDAELSSLRKPQKNRKSDLPPRR